MITFLRLLGLALIAGSCLALSVAGIGTFAAFGVGFFIGICVMGFGLCVMAGQVTKQDLDEANGLRHPDNLEGKN